MLYEDEDDVFIGSPKSKFFDIVYNANRNLVEGALEDHIERHIALEIILEKFIAEEDLDLEREIRRVRVERQDDIDLAKVDFFISMTGDIVSQNE